MQQGKPEKSNKTLENLPILSIVEAIRDNSVASDFTRHQEP